MTIFEHFGALMTNKAPYCAFLWLTITVLSRQIQSLTAYQVILWSLLIYQVGLWSLPTFQVGPRNQCKPRLIKDLRSTKDYVRKNKLFLQNEPNFKKSQMYLSPFITTNYEQRTMNYEVKNEPKTNPNEPNFSQ